MSFKSVNPQPTPSGAGGFTSSYGAGYTPGETAGPYSPGEAPNQHLTPDCPQSEEQIAQMEKK